MSGNIRDMADERVLSVKAKVDALKARVRASQDAMPILKDDGKKGLRGGWTAYDRHCNAHRKLLDELRGAKAELAKLCGTTGSAPAWDLLATAWHVLQCLEESGVDIGEDGRALVEDIEFHVPGAKLMRGVAE